MPSYSNQQHLGQAESLWVATSPTTNFPSLVTAPPHDVIVIGAGIAGLTTAYLLQTQGVRVVLLEMGKIVKGVTGYTTAKVTSLHTLIYDYLITHFGEEQAHMYGEANQAGLNMIATLVDQLQIACDFKRTTAYTFTCDAKESKNIEAEVEAAQKLGLPASYVTQTPLPLAVKAAITFSEQAQFHPRKYLLKIADAFINAGGRIFEDTRVFKIEDGTPIKVTTARGTLSAAHVVIATHYPIYDPALYFTRLIPHRSCVLGVRLEEKAPEGMFIDSVDEYPTMRNQPTEDGEIFLIGGENYKTGQGGDIIARYERLEKVAREYFPVKSVDYHWSTQDNMTLDRVPFIGKIDRSDTNIYVATGFGGWGMTNGSAAGMILSDLILGKENPWAQVFNPVRFKPVASAKPLIAEGANVAKEIVGGLLPKPAAEAAQTLAVGEGMVVHHEGERVAISRDEQGRLHAVSAICTHMGCVVNWNNAERSWDCPCHASRFAPDGTVLHGPAVKDLEQKQIEIPQPVVDRQE
ncbi:MAG: FAD-dependent oxidoreductase [Anaerolineae bacterium]